MHEFGYIADEFWRTSPDHFDHVELRGHVIMPNRVRGIFVINHSSVGARHVDDDTRRGTIYRAPTAQFGKLTPGSLPTIIRTYKAAVNRRIGREFEATDIWQRNSCENVIRNDREMENIWRYIEPNPLNCNTDNENLNNR